VSTSNKFSFIRDTVQTREPRSSQKKRTQGSPKKTSPPNAEKETTQKGSKRRKNLQQAESVPEQDKKLQDAQATQSKKMGRPRGKRSNPDYEQVTAYIRRETYTATKIALLQEGLGREFSELVEDLLTEYLQHP
jgi:uncharacterized Rmd1/YagE family protein